MRKTFSPLYVLVHDPLFTKKTVLVLPELFFLFLFFEFGFRFFFGSERAEDRPRIPTVLSHVIVRRNVQAKTAFARARRDGYPEFRN